ncbi:ribosome biogenesis factor YjgA [Comamonas composti]|uniref:ribosome biogenesis factor YjgA n=1 Tax=Comamonas composti TaxID=408558 RepID=UPI0004275949|nr:ribosome biogenesis factor YjgA [Comamonas composti]
MSRKPKKGYFVKGQFVAEGSDLDLELKAELKGTSESSKTDLKREMDALQELGKELMSLRADLFKRLDLSEQLVEALAEARRITNFEGKRRQMQYVGKLMRKLDETQIEAINQALDEQRNGSAAEKMALHAAEQWRDRLIAEESALSIWLEHFPDTDIQQLRALIRQARKDLPQGHEARVQESTGQAQRKSRAYRELFQLVREQLGSTGQGGQDGGEAEDESHD